MLIGVFGTFGSGKTLLLTIFGFLCADNPKYQVYANYKIKHKKVVSPISAEEFIEINPEKKKVLILLDEVYAWLDSRLSTSRVNRVLSWCVLQSRKRNMDIIYDAQLMGSVDLRLRNLSDIVIMCEKTKDAKETIAFVYRVFHQTSWHKTRQYLFVVPEEKASQFYNKFDTRQIVMPIENIFPKVKKK